MKPLFIPLKTKFYEDFLSGKKRVEYRLYGARWNERTCSIGRAVVLSKGYGVSHRQGGKVVGFSVSKYPTLTKAWKECFGMKGDQLAACIEIELD